jgi:Ni,Fe-hydrogenase I large subunit
MSSLTHFYHLVAPSYIQGPSIPPWTPYFRADYFNALLQNVSGTWPNEVPTRALPEKSIDGTFSDNLWSTVIRSYVKALRIRRLTFEAGALFAGRMPMTSCYVAGGVSFDGTEDLSDRCDTFKSITEEVGLFIVQEYVPIALALGALYPNYDNSANAATTAAVNLLDASGNPTGPTLFSVGDRGTGSTDDAGWGAGTGNFLVWGAFPDPDDATLHIGGGVWTNGAGGSLLFPLVTNEALVASTWLTGANSVPTNLKEDIVSSRYGDTAGEYTSNQAYPGAVTRTEPERDKAGAYTYMKAPRWAGNNCEVGPYADMVVNGLYPLSGGLWAGALSGLVTTSFYAKDNGTNVGLDPAMVEADIAVALLREGLAYLDISGNAVYAQDTVGLTAEQIAAAYGAAGTVILGPITAWILGLQGGLSTIDRIRARAIQSAVLVQKMIGAFDKTTGTWDSTVTPASSESWIDRLKAEPNTAGSTWRNLPIPTTTKQGWGANQAPRGSLMHQITITGGKIDAYQCIVPTTWNGSPADTATLPGAIEKAMEGIPYSNPGAGGLYTDQSGNAQTTGGGVEALRVAQSFDPCIACAVH